MTRPWHTFDETAQREALERALISERGNIARAAAVLELSRSHTMRLVTKYGLAAGAAELRGQKTGRPRKRGLIGRPAAKLSPR